MLSSGISRLLHKERILSMRNKLLNHRLSGWLLPLLTQIYYKLINRNPAAYRKVKFLRNGQQSLLYYSRKSPEKSISSHKCNKYNNQWKKSSRKDMSGWSSREPKKSITRATHVSCSSLAIQIALRLCTTTLPLSSQIEISLGTIVKFLEFLKIKPESMRNRRTGFC